MHKDISQIIKKYTWYMINRNTLQKLRNGKYYLLPGTWAFQLKQLPNVSPLKLNSRYCVQDDKKSE